MNWDLFFEVKTQYKSIVFNSLAEFTTFSMSKNKVYYQLNVIEKNGYGLKTLIKAIYDE